MSEELRRQLIDIALEMNRSGINQGTSGNLSVRLGEGMLITPSGIPYPALAPPDIVYVDRSGKTDGSRKPSSEWRIHSDIYKAREDARAILHAHPAECVALACMQKAIPAFHYMVAVAGGRNIRCAPRSRTRQAQDRFSALSLRVLCVMWPSFSFRPALRA